MKLKMAIAAMASLLALSAQAGINIEWYVPYGVYPNGAADVTSTTPGTGLLANNGSGSTIIQLVYCGADNTIDIVDPNNSGSGYVSDDDVVWQSYTITSGSGGYDQWVYTSTPPSPYVNATFTSGFVYARVFQDTTPIGGEWYYNTATMATADRTSDTTQKQTLTIGTESTGVALNVQMVPEPSVFMLAGLGVVVVALRSRRKA